MVNEPRVIRTTSRTMTLHATRCDIAPVSAERIGGEVVVVGRAVQRTRLQRSSIRNESRKIAGSRSMVLFATGFGRRDGAAERVGEEHPAIGLRPTNRNTNQRYVAVETQFRTCPVDQAMRGAWLLGLGTDPVLRGAGQ